VESLFRFGTIGLVTPPPCPERRLRADAEQNRERLLVAARAAFAEEGLDVPIAEVARRAGVGVATLYRRFPERDDLITAVFDDKMSAYVAAAEEALADPEPWHGFCLYVETLCAMQAADRGFTEVLTNTFPMAKEFEAKRRQAYESFAELIARAQSAGRLRPDFVHQDLVLVLMANAGVVAAIGQTLPDAWRRPLAQLLQSFDARNTDPLPPAPSDRQLFRAMARLRTTTRGEPPR
jgi:AcrR family transcriptional regulator